MFNIEGDFNDLVDSLRRIQLRAAAVGTSPSVHAYYMQALSDLAATAAISGLQYQQLVQFVRASDPAAISAFDAFKAHGDKQRLRWELLGCLPKAATVAAPTEPEAASTSHHGSTACPVFVISLGFS